MGVPSRVLLVQKMASVNSSWLKHRLGTHEVLTMACVLPSTSLYAWERRMLWLKRRQSKRRAVLYSCNADKFATSDSSCANASNSFDIRKVSSLVGPHCAGNIYEQ